MDFVVGFPWTEKQHDSICVVVDRLNKSAHFIPVMSTFSAKDYARIFIDDIVCRHGIPSSIISDRGARFTSRFWRSSEKGLGTKVTLSTAFHPQWIVKRSILFKPLWICLEIVLLTSREIGIETCRWLSLRMIKFTIHLYV